MTKIFHRLLQRFGVVGLTLLMTLLAMLLSVGITCGTLFVLQVDDWYMGILLALVVPAIIAPFTTYHTFALIRQLDETEQRLRVLATIDDLTQTFNRRHFLELARRECEKSSRYGFALSVILLDIDHFKQINDEYTHLAGDVVLSAVGSTTPAILRSSDILGRFGGDEFILFLPHTDRDQAVVTAERLRNALADLAIQHNGSQISFTVSLGVATSEAYQCSLDKLLYHADLALYRAKDNGRNRVESTFIQPQAS